MSLTAEQIKAAPLKVERVETPEWGEDSFVFARVLPAKYATQIVNWNSDDSKTEEDTVVTWAIWGMCDESGTPLFTDDDKEAVAGMAWPALQRVAMAAVDLNQLSVVAREDTAKN